MLKNKEISIETSPGKIKSFVGELYENGKKPCEKFGVTHKQLSDLEKNVPELTCKTGKNNKE